MPHGDRSKVAIEPFLTDQWYVDAKTLAEPALAAVREGRTRILPERDEKTYFHWLENIEPWCISRQLWWGHRIPVWYGDYVGHDGRLLHLTGEVPPKDEPHVFLEHGRWLRAFCGVGADAVREDAENWYRSRMGHRVIVRFEGEPEDEGGEFPEERSTAFVTLRRDPDVLDTWFSSGIWPLGTLGWPDDTPELRRYYPTSVLVTGFDIIFFWVARMMMMQLALVGEVPFREVYIHALVRDEKGKKMSKSLGNILDPIELIDEFGADAVRFTLTAMAAMGRDLKLSRDRIAGYRNFGTKLWNAARFAEMNDCRPDPAFDPTAVTLTANKWIVGETGRLRETLDAALAAYRFNDAANALYAHVWGKVCDWYVELAKPLFEGEGAAETRATMAWVLDQCLVMMHPVMPFITEALWGQTGGRAKLLCHADWPEYGAELVDGAADAEMGWVIGLIEEIRSARAQLHVPVGARVTLIALELSEAQAEALERNRALVAKLARIERFEKAAEAPKGAITLSVQGAAFCLPLAEVIDIAAERERLRKALDKLEKEAEGIRAKLANANFVARAPEEVVDEQRARLEAAEEEIAVLRAARPSRRTRPRLHDAVSAGGGAAEPRRSGRPYSWTSRASCSSASRHPRLAVGAVVGAVEIGALLGLDEKRAAPLRGQLDRGERGRHRPCLGRHPVGEDQARVRHDVQEDGLVDDLRPVPKRNRENSRPPTRKSAVYSKISQPAPSTNQRRLASVSAKARNTRAGGAA